MKHFTSFCSLSIIVVLLTIISCQSPSKTIYLGVPVTEIKSQLDDLLDNYFPRIIDTVNGGYWTNFENDWTLASNQDKMLVTQSRGLWTAARAAEMFPNNPILREAADHGFRFITRHMWDSVNGGFFQNYYVDSLNKTNEPYKLTYGNAFALYGLAQYARVNKDPEVLEWVKKTFNWLENAVHDPVDKGYFSISVLSENANRYKVPEGWQNPKGKDQNTSIHLLEGLTAAYLVMPEQIVRNRLEEILELVRDIQTTSEGYLNLFFDKKWQPVSLKDSSRSYIMQNPWYDHISFGHDIETAYLLLDASKALYGKPDTLTARIAKKLTDHTLQYGFDADYYGLFDKGYKFSDEPEVIDSSKVWWAQAEAWHALALFSELYPREAKYKEVFGKIWNYITSEVIDKEYGGWYNSGLDSNPRTVNQRKAHAWKSCYHDGRALMQVYSYAVK